MNAMTKFFTMAAVMLVSACLLQGCKEKTAESEPEKQRGEPVLSHEAPVYDEATQTFSLTVRADSTGGATVSFALLDGDSIIMKSEDGTFRGIAPFEEGYNVSVEVQWEDTTIVRTLHVMDFVVPREPVEQIAKEELEKLINSCDKSLRRGQNDHLAQGVKLVVNDSKAAPPQMLPDVITLIENGVWKKVEVVSLEYDDNNLVTTITLKPIGEVVNVDEEDEDFDY
jgi:hypothetical protein